MYRSSTRRQLVWVLFALLLHAVSSPTARSQTDQASIPGSLQIDLEPNRTWTNIFGEQSEAQLLQYFGANVLLRPDEGVVVVPLSTLSPEDLDYVQSVLQELGQLEILPGKVSPNEESSHFLLEPPEWKLRLKAWTANVGSTDKEQALAAWNNIRGIKDPKALGELSKLLDRQRDFSVAVACVEALAGISGPEATRLLVNLAVTDQRVPVVTSATWALRQLDQSLVATALDEYAKLLRTESHRAACVSNLFVTGLSNAKTSQSEMHPELTKTLITLLTVKQPERVPVFRWRGYKFSSATSSQSHLHGHGTTVVIYHEVPFASALELLVQHTRQDYGYDRRAWRNWYAREQAKSKPAP